MWLFPHMAKVTCLHSHNFMNKLLDRFVYLLGVRKIIALTLTGTFVYLSVNGLITKDEFLPIFSLVTGYYFGKSTALEKPHE